LYSNSRTDPALHTVSFRENPIASGLVNIRKLLQPGPDASNAVPMTSDFERTIILSAVQHDRHVVP
jgi:hypothetical protein